MNVHFPKGQQVTFGTRSISLNLQSSISLFTSINIASISSTLIPKAFVKTIKLTALKPLKLLANIVLPNSFCFSPLAHSFDGQANTFSLTSMNPASSYHPLYLGVHHQSFPKILAPSINFAFQDSRAVLVRLVSLECGRKYISCISKKPPGSSDAKADWKTERGSRKQENKARPWM